MSAPAARPEGHPVRQWTREERVRASIAYWLFVVACLAIAAGGFYLVHLEGTPGRTATPVSATIEHVEVIARKDGHGRAVTIPLVIYSYSVNGVRYTTDRVTSLGRSHGSGWAAEIARRYHPGQTVTAYVATLDPGSAFLVPDHDWRAYAFLIVPLLIAVGLAAYWPWSGIRGSDNR